MSEDDPRCPTLSQWSPCPTRAGHVRSAALEGLAGVDFNDTAHNNTFSDISHCLLENKRITKDKKII